MAQFNRNDKREDEYSETVVALNRVSKTVKGGRVKELADGAREGGLQF